MRIRELKTFISKLRIRKQSTPVLRTIERTLLTLYIDHSGTFLKFKIYLFVHNKARMISQKATKHVGREELIDNVVIFRAGLIYSVYIFALLRNNTPANWRWIIYSLNKTFVLDQHFMIYRWQQMCFGKPSLARLLNDFE